MKKLLLASDGKFLIDRGYQLIGIPKDQMKIGYITTASKGARDTAYLENHKVAMKEHGYQFEEIDIEGKNEQEIRLALKNKTVIHIEGGNTFYLLKVIKESAFEKLLVELIDAGIPYIGTSAGSYIACPTIEMATWGPDIKNRYGLEDLNALNLVPFLLKVHYEDSMEEFLKEKITQCKYPVKVLRDGQALIIQDSDVRDIQFVGEGHEVKI